MAKIRLRPPGSQSVSATPEAPGVWLGTLDLGRVWGGVALVQGEATEPWLGQASPYLICGQAAWAFCPLPTPACNPRLDRVTRLAFSWLLNLALLTAVAISGEPGTALDMVSPTLIPCFALGSSGRITVAAARVDTQVPE